MEAKYGKANRVWVMDRGMVSEKNLEFMRKTGARCLVGTPRAMLVNDRLNGATDFRRNGASEKG